MRKYSEKKFERIEGCDCFKCREVEFKKEWKNDINEEKHDVNEKTWDKKSGCDCFKCREITINVECNKGNEKHSEDKPKKNDKNDWIREKLEAYIDTRVVISTIDSTHATGRVIYVKKEYVVLGPTFPYSPVTLESNAFPSPLAPIELFKQYYIRLDAIAGFGQQQNALPLPSAPV